MTGYNAKAGHDPYSP